VNAMTSTIRLALGMLLAAVSCGETDAPPAAGDAALPEDGRADSGPKEDLSADTTQPPSRRWVETADAINDCLPRTLDVDGDGRAMCVMVVMLPLGTVCDPNRGLSAVDAQLLQSFSNWLRPGELGTSAICEAIQLGTADFVDGDCIAATKPGWCLIQRNASMCRQGIHRSPTLAITADTRQHLGCISASFSVR
jgi:hypothetical protein